MEYRWYIHLWYLHCWFAFLSKTNSPYLPVKIVSCFFPKNSHVICSFVKQLRWLAVNSSLRSCLVRWVAYLHTPGCYRGCCWTIFMHAWIAVLPLRVSDDAWKSCPSMQRHDECVVWLYVCLELCPEWVMFLSLVLALLLMSLLGMDNAWLI